VQLRKTTLILKQRGSNKKQKILERERGRESERGRSFITLWLIPQCQKRQPLPAAHGKLMST